MMRQSAFQKRAMAWTLFWIVSELFGSLPIYPDDKMVFKFGQVVHRYANLCISVKILK